MSMETIVKEAQEDFRDRVSTFDKQGKRVWLHPQKPKGKLTNARTYVSIVLLALLFGMPFIKVNGEPLLLLNVIERKFVIFGVVFWPQDFFLFGLAMLTFMLFIVLFTVVFGRLWCGWACPQTIFMENVFRRIEYLIEGDASRQRALAKAPWNAEKIIKKTAKHSIFFLISFIIANTFLSYIIGVDNLFTIISEPIAYHIGGLISILIFTGVFYFVFAWFREQACIVVCPYGRLQGVLLDKNSIVVAYDYLRGEPRGKYKKNDTSKGDCIDCNQCVKVCPTGIDIRNGTQLECINCTACIDACNFMMKSVGREEGLIRYASEKGIAEKIKLTLTPRMIGYAAVLCVLISILGFSLASRQSVATTILRTPGILYQEQGKDSISNLFNIKIVNKTHDNIPTRLQLEGIGGTIKMVGNKDILVKSSNIGEGEFFVVLGREAITARKTKIRIGIYSGDKKIETVETTFMGPVRKKRHEHEEQEHHEDDHHDDDHKEEGK